MPTLIYKYGLRRPVVSAALVDAQMQLAHRYYNASVEIERTRRAAAREALAQADERHGLTPLIEQVDTIALQYKTAQDEIKAVRKASRSRSDTAAMRSEATRLRGQLKELRGRLKDARAAHRGDAEAKAAMQVSQEAANAAGRAARAICGLYWGTYLIVEAAIAEAAKAPLWHRGQPNDPRYKRWCGEGTVAVQLQKGLLAESALSCDDRRLQLDLDPPPAPGASKRQRKLRKGTLRLRVGSNGREPIWAEWPLQMHRPLPQGAVIRWAKVLRRYTSNHDRWELQLTVEVPDVQPTHGAGVVAIDIGWRRLDDGIRVAYALGEHNDGELRLSSEILSGLRKADDLRSIRDKAQNEMAAQLTAWLETHQDELTEELIERTKTIKQWRSPARFAALAQAWRAAGGCGAAYEALEAWRRHDLHLWQWEAHQREKSRRRRKDNYRCWAKQLAEHYHTAVIETHFLAKTQMHHLPEDEKPEIAAQRLQQRDAACYELVECIQHAFKRAGGATVRVPAAQTTQRCAVCGSERAWDAAPHVEHTCEDCGATWDQDRNACRNLLAKHEQSSGDEAPNTERSAKWARLGRHKKTACKASCNTAEM